MTRYLLTTFAAFILTTGCLGDPWAEVPVTCRSPRGTAVHVKPGAEHFDCRGYDVIESEVVAAIQHYMGPKPHAQLLKDLPNTHVVVWPTDTDLTSGGRDVDGYATCMGGVAIKAGLPSTIRPDRNWIWSALPHELAHVAQACNAYSPKPRTELGDPGDADYDHANFISSGFSAVDAMYEEEQRAQIHKQWTLEQDAKLAADYAAGLLTDG